MSEQEKKTCPLARAGLLANPEMWGVITGQNKGKGYTMIGDTRKENNIIDRIITYTQCEREFCHWWDEANDYAVAGCTIKTIFKGRD